MTVARIYNVGPTKSLSDTVPITLTQGLKVILVKVSNDLNFGWRKHTECYRVVFHERDSEANGS